MFAPRFFASRFFGRRYFPKGATVAVEASGIAVAANKFRSAIVPDFKDLAEVQRFLQRTIDEISKAANPTRAVADGGTGFSGLQHGEILVAGADGQSFVRIPPNLTATRMVLVSTGTGSSANIPAWEAQDASTPATGTGVLVGADTVVVGSATVTIP